MKPKKKKNTILPHLPDGVQEITTIFENIYQGQLLNDKMLKIQNKYLGESVNVKSIDCFDKPDFYVALLSDISVILLSKGTVILKSIKSSTLRKYTYELLLLLQSNPVVYDIPEVKMHFSLLYNLFCKSDNGQEIISNFINSVFQLTSGFFKKEKIAQFGKLLLKDFDQLIIDDYIISLKKINTVVNTKYYSIMNEEQTIKKTQEKQVIKRLEEEEKEEEEERQQQQQEDDNEERKNYILDQKQNLNNEDLKIASQKDITVLKLIDLNKIREIDTVIMYTNSNNEILYGLLENLNTFILQITIRNNLHEAQKLNTPLDKQDSLYLNLLIKDIEKTLKKKRSEEQDENQKFQEVLYTQKTIDLFINIWKSDAVKSYFENEIEYIKQEIINSKNIIEFKDIDNHNLREYYIYSLKYIKENSNILTPGLMKKYIYLIRICKQTKGFTTNFLRIAINSNHVKLNIIDETEESFKNLVQIYFILVLLHESCHFLRRCVNIGKKVEDIQTPKTKESKDREGGEELFLHLFQKKYIGSFDEKQVIKLLEPKNWITSDMLQDIINNTSESCNSISFMNQKTGWGPCVVRE